MRVYLAAPLQSFYTPRYSRRSRPVRRPFSLCLERYDIIDSVLPAVRHAATLCLPAVNPRRSFGGVFKLRHDFGIRCTCVRQFKPSGMAQAMRCKIGTSAFSFSQSNGQAGDGLVESAHLPRVAALVVCDGKGFGRRALQKGGETAVFTFVAQNLALLGRPVEPTLGQTVVILRDDPSAQRDVADCTPTEAALAP